MLDQGGCQWRDDQHAAPGAGGCDPQGRVAPFGEPSADNRQRRHVDAGGTQTHANAVCQVATPHPFDERGGDEAGAQQDCPRTHDNSWPEAIAQMAGERAERIEGQPGDREERGRGGATGVKLRRHRLDECTEAVGDSENDEAGEKGSRDREPGAARIDRGRCDAAHRSG